MKPFSKNIAIMLIDDDPEESMLFEEALNEVNTNHSYKWFSSGDEALSFLNLPETDIPDVLFLDLNMPRKNGKVCLKEIRALKKYSRMPIAIYSTSNAREDMQDTLAEGANIYMPKPNDYETLKSLLRKVLDIQWQYHSLHFNFNTFVVSL